jgi:diguanylate cyclase (GGDEF)-like protein
MYEMVASSPSAEQEFQRLNNSLLFRGSTLIAVSLSVILAIVFFYIFYGDPKAKYNFWGIVLVAIASTTYLMALYSLYLFKRQPQQKTLFYFGAILLTTTWIVISIVVNTVWQEPDASKRILLIGFFIILLGWHPNLILLTITLTMILSSYWLIGTKVQHMTFLDLVLSIVKFPMFIIIFYFTVRKLLSDSKAKYIENLKLLKQLNDTLHIDELTQINNRKGFNRHFASSLQTARRLKAPLTLVILDIDFFKQYNDSLGHPQGDQCLKQFSAVLSDNCKRAVDSVSRIGGEEFAFILTGSDTEQASAFMDKLQREMINKAIVHPQSSISQYVTFSAGIGQFDEAIDDQESLYQKADRALYKAKDAGRNQYACEK